MSEKNTINQVRQILMNELGTMSTKLSESELAEIRERYSFRNDPCGCNACDWCIATKMHIPALLDHCAALGEELKSAQNELSKAARLINCAGPLDYRVQMMKLDYSGQITKLEEELKAAQELIPLAAFNAHQIDERVARSIMNTAINNFRAQLVEAVRGMSMIYDRTSRESVIQLIQTFEEK